MNTYTFGLGYVVDESGCETSPIPIHKDKNTQKYLSRRRTRALLLSHELRAFRFLPGASGMLWQPGKEERVDCRYDNMRDDL